MWSFCEHDDPEGNPNPCGGKCHLSFIPEPTANVGSDGKYAKPPAEVKVQGTQLEVPWVTGVLDKVKLPKQCASGRERRGRRRRPPSAAAACALTPVPGNLPSRARTRARQ